MAGRPTIYRENMCGRVIEMGKQGKSLTQIACGLGISRETLYAWKDEKPLFSDALKESVGYAQTWWEEMGERLAEGEAKGSAAVYIFLMKNRFRPREGDKDENYADRHEHTGKDGKDLVVAFPLPQTDFDQI